MNESKPCVPTLTTATQVPPLLRPSPTGSPRGSRGAEVQRPPGPTPPCQATQPAARGQGADGKTPSLHPELLPWASPPPTARRSRPSPEHHPEPASPASVGAPSVPQGMLPRVPHAPPGRPPRQPVPRDPRDGSPSFRLPRQCSGKLASFQRRISCESQAKEVLSGLCS